MNWVERFVLIDDRTGLQVTVAYSNEHLSYFFAGVDLRVGITYPPSVGYATAEKAMKAAETWVERWPTRIGGKA